MNHKEVVISSEEQLLVMENIALAGGSQDYENIRTEMSLYFDAEYGKYARITYEPISNKDVSMFVQFLDDCEE